MGHGCHDCGSPNGCDCKIEPIPSPDAYLEKLEGAYKRVTEAREAVYQATMKLEGNQRYLKQAQLALEQLLGPTLRNALYRKAVG